MGGFDGLAEQLEAIKRQQLYRSRVVSEGPQGAEITIDGKVYLNFSSNDYLGLANHPDVVASFQAAANVYGVGGGASHLVSGHSIVHQALEEALANFTNRSRALLFSSGYMANFGVINSLLERSDSLFQDRLNHASLLDAGLLSGARFQRFQHANIADLKQRLVKSDAKRKLVVSDGVFSMDGDLAPLTELASTAQQQGAWLMVDDAHGMGCLGHGGRGSLCLSQLDQQQVPVLMGTLGKAFGTAGAFVAGSEALIETLIQRARTYIYTTAIPPAVAAATLTSLKLVETEHWRRKQLAALINQFHEGAQALGLPLLTSQTSIQPIIIGDDKLALQMSQALKTCGMMVAAIRPPTVPVGTARLRVTLSAVHNRHQVDQLLNALAETAESLCVGGRL